MGEETHLSRAKKRVLRAMLAEPERTWTSRELVSRARSVEAVNELLVLLPYLGALDVVEPPTWRLRGGWRMDDPPECRLESPGLYRLTRQGPERVQLLLDGARPVGVLATLVREGPRPAVDAWLMRRHHRAWQARNGHEDTEASPLSYVPRRRHSFRALSNEIGRRRRPPPR